MNDIHESNQMDDVQNENPQLMNDTNEQNQMNKTRSPNTQQIKEAKKKANLPGCSVVCIVLAILCFLLSFYSVNDTKRIIAEVERDLVVLESATVMPENEGKPVLVSGKLSVKGELKDNDFSVAVKAPKLNRIVYMFQWEEYTNTDRDGDVTYTYSQIWSNALIDSSSFHSWSRENPKKKPLESKYFDRETSIGDFILTDAQMKELETNAIFTELDTEVGRKHGLHIADNSYTNVVGKSSKIGDIMIKFHYLDTEKLGNVTILAKQKGYGFEGYKSESGTKLDKFWTESVNKAGVISKLNDEGNSAKFGSYMMSGIFLIAGIVVFFYKRT